jgi:DNA primase small subunit
MIARAYKVLEPMFISSVIPETGHGLLASEEQWEKLLNTLPSCAHQVRDNLTQKWQKEGHKTSPVEKWDTVKKHLEVAFGTSDRNTKGKLAKHLSNQERAQVENWPVQVVLEYTYPRLDINVSKMQNHLLKSPFCVHPKTGRVCVPIAVEKIEEFDPFTVPTLPQLMKELDAYNAENGEESSSNTNGGAPEWSKTSLKEYFAPFQKDFLTPMLSELRRQQRDEAEQQAAMTGDF